MSNDLRWLALASASIGASLMMAIFLDSLPIVLTAIVLAILANKTGV